MNKCCIPLGPNDPVPWHPSLYPNAPYGFKEVDCTCEVNGQVCLVHGPDMISVENAIKIALTQGGSRDEFEKT